jgi:hypothetical protein
VPAVRDPARLDLRPVAVKISNAPPLVRPRPGSGQADVVFEHYADGGLTASRPSTCELPRRVGSVRSARLMTWKSRNVRNYLVYAGSSEGGRQRIEAPSSLPRLLRS